jgi:hypothetical protein
VGQHKRIGRTARPVRRRVEPLVLLTLDVLMIGALVVAVVRIAQLLAA